MIVNKIFIRKSQINTDVFIFSITCDFCKKLFKREGTENTIKTKFCSQKCNAKFRVKYIKTDYEKTSNSLKKFYLTHTVWNKNTTKETNESIRKMSESLKNPESRFQKIVKSKEHKRKLSVINSGNKNGFYGKSHTKDFKKRQSNTMSEKIANGTFQLRGNGRFVKGWYLSDKNNQQFYYDSFWELLRMKILDLDSSVVSWNKKHGIRIPYMYKGIEKIYIPDFIIVYENKKVLEEIKGWEEPEKKKTKLLSLKKYCVDNNLESRILTFSEMQLLSKQYFHKTIKQLRKEFKNS